MALICFFPLVKLSFLSFGEKSKIRTIMPLKVIQGHQDQYQSKVRMRLPISE